ncbi:MAG TPA: ferredoxin family protein [Thermodesulfobacteriota bacterium]|nr:ferredoxin family protein [Thermodesulfobacteriota bacterium]
MSDMGLGVLIEKRGKTSVWSGISQKARGKLVTITLNQRFCKGCEICVEICPNKCLEMEGPYPVVRDINLCSKCMLCELECPDFAITIE